ncbi:MAG TPA: hypothetical protein VIK10_05810 [Prolixibacteraceae bacterium]
MKNFNYQTVEVLSNVELAAVKGGISIPTPIIITDFSAEPGNSEFGTTNAAAMISK